MAAALQVVASQGKRDALVVKGTGFADTQAFTVKVSGPTTSSPDITYGGTTSGAGAIDTTGALEIVPNNGGIMTVTVDDGTTTVVTEVEVFES